MIHKQFIAWAIRVQPTHPKLSPHLIGALMGRYCFDRTTPIPPANAGCHVALFATREIARHYARPLTKLSGDGWRAWAVATPVKVKVTIEAAS